MLPLRALSVVVLCTGFGWLAAPLSWEVEGLSMAPGLMPGDLARSGWFPLLDGWRRPARLERWIVRAPDGTTAVKRVVGLPGEQVAIEAGDLFVDGTVVVKPPDVLGQMALPVPALRWENTGTTARLAIDPAILDDVPFAPGERRLLLPVRDVGLAAVIDVPVGAGGGGPVGIDVHIGERLVRATVPRSGRYGLVAGRLDCRLVAGAWWAGQAGGEGRPWPFSVAANAWALCSGWPGDDPPTFLAVTVTARPGASAVPVIESITAWRDVHHLPPADGTTTWTVADGATWLLGDFPAGSRDSRHWGAVALPRHVHRVLGSLTPAPAR